MPVTADQLSQQIFNLSNALGMSSILSQMQPQPSGLYPGMLPNERKQVQPWLPQQMSSPGSLNWDTVIRQKAAQAGRQGVPPGMALDQVLPSQASYSNGMLNNGSFLDALNVLQKNQISRSAMNIASKTDAVIPGSLLDPNSKPFAPRCSLGNHPTLEKFDDDDFFEKDSNANVVRRSSSYDHLESIKIRKIWECPEGFAKLELGGPSGDAGCAKLAPGSVISSTSAGVIGAKPDGGSVSSISLGSDSDEESALKSKHQSSRFRRESSTSMRDADCDDDPFGLRVLVKAVQDRGIFNDDHEEETKFVEKIASQSQNNMVHPYIGGALNNHVVTPLYDSSQESPEEYLKVTTMLNEHLMKDNGPRTMADWPSDLLFVCFYLAPNDFLQLMAGNYLHRRGWRYSKSRNIWIARQKNTQLEFRTDTSEGGYYQFFNVSNWRREVKHFTLTYSDLADRIPLEAVWAQIYGKTVNPASIPPAFSNDTDLMLMHMLKYPIGQKMTSRPSGDF